MFYLAQIPLILLRICFKRTQINQNEPRRTEENRGEPGRTEESHKKHKNLCFLLLF